MPNIYNALVVKGRDTAGQQINVTCEVQQLLGNNRVRAVAIGATDGLTRGMEVIDTGAPLSVSAHWGVFVFGGIGERTREGNDLYMEMKESGVINEKNIAESKVALVYGQMNEPPGAHDLTDPAPATTFAHLDATTILSRGLTAKAVDIGILKILLNGQWLMMVLMGDFARIGNNEITILVNDVEKGSDIDSQEAQQTLEIAEANLRKAEGKRQKIEANLALRPINEISELVGVSK
ncbi:hypothetical protein AgCh_031193 [Apium graveolens]